MKVSAEMYETLLELRDITKKSSPSRQQLRDSPRINISCVGGTAWSASPLGGLHSTATSNIVQAFMAGPVQNGGDYAIWNTRIV